MKRNKLVIVVFGVVAAAAGVASPIGARASDDLSSTSSSGDDSDSTSEALRASRRATPGAARIARLLTETHPELGRPKAIPAWASALYWRDPFSDHPRRRILLRPEVRLSMQLAVARGEAAIAREEAATARAELAVFRARALAAKLAAQAGRATQATSEGCASPALAQSEATPSPGANPEVIERRARRERRRKNAAHRARSLGTALAQNDRRDVLKARPHGDRLDRSRIRTTIPSPPPLRPSIDESPDWSSSDPRGILVVPISSPGPRRR